MTAAVRTNFDEHSPQDFAPRLLAAALAAGPAFAAKDKRAAAASEKGRRRPR